MAFQPRTEHLFHHDPAVAILDAWAFSMQMANYFERGEGKEDFGHWYQIAYDSSLKLEKRLAQLVASGGAGRKH
jgi:hypothetical protein